ncbi:MAG: hypothetical protein ACLFWL_02020 [Candidatus Brocadiia bacterium]
MGTMLEDQIEDVVPADSQTGGDIEITQDENEKRAFLGSVKRIICMSCSVSGVFFILLGGLFVLIEDWPGTLMAYVSTLLGCFCILGAFGATGIGEET